jgi:hypothetical protein
MRRLIVMLVALGALAVPGTALAKHPGGGAAYPEKIALPNAFAPEGIEIAHGSTFYVGSTTTGAIYKGDLRTGAGAVLVPGATTPGTNGATGIEYHRGLLYVAGAGYGTGTIYDAKTGALVKQYTFATAPGTFINDVVVTRHAAYFTDSQKAVIYSIPVWGKDWGKHGWKKSWKQGKKAPADVVTTIPLTGDYQHVAGQFNLNGIVATPNGKALIAVQTVAKKLLLIDPATGVAKAIDTGGYDLVNGDGLLLKGHWLYVVQNRSNQIAVFKLSWDWTKATHVTTLTDPDFDVPTTIDNVGKHLWAVNARFGTSTPADILHTQAAQSKKL